jgi:hypothetical protein
MSSNKHDVIVSTGQAVRKVDAAIKAHGLEVIYADEDSRTGHCLRILELARTDILLPDLPPGQAVVLRIAEDGDYRFSGWMANNTFGIEIEVTAGIAFSLDRIPSLQAKLKGQGGKWPTVKQFLTTAEVDENDDSLAYRVTTTVSSAEFAVLMNGIKVLSEDVMVDDGLGFFSVHFEDGCGVQCGDFFSSTFIGPDCILLLTSSGGRNGRLRPNGDGLVFDDEGPDEPKSAWPFV